MWNERRAWAGHHKDFRVSCRDIPLIPTFCSKLVSEPLGCRINRILAVLVSWG